MKIDAQAPKQQTRQPGLLFSLQPLAFSLLLCLPSLAFSQKSICASVRIEILQQLTLERQAFEARMTINNGLAGVSLVNISINLTFTDSAGNSVRASSDPNDLTARFFFRLQDGSSTPSIIPGGTSATIVWLIIPTQGAAGATPRKWSTKSNPISIWPS